MLNMQSIIRRMVQDEIQKMIGDELNTGSEPTSEPSDNPSHDDAYTRTVERIQSKRTKRGPGRQSVQYVLMAVPRGMTREKIAKDLPPAYASVYRALVKAGGSGTQRDLEKLSGEKHKTVQSAVYQLRMMKLVKSEKLSA